MIIHSITVPQTALTGFARAVRAVAELLPADVEAGLAGMFMSMNPNDLRSLANDLHALASVTDEASQP